MAIIAPSLLSADFLNLERDCKMLDESEAEWFHLDVMDGRFVPNISYGMSIIKQMRKTTKKFFDVHLMILEPEKYVKEFKEAGANGITIHLEACNHLNSNINYIKSLGIKTGVAINPHTPISSLHDILSEVDMVLIMSVNPGFGGQSFIPNSLNKLRELKALISERKLHVKIEIDGGVTMENANEIITAGADVLVAGNAIFSSQDPVATIKQLKSI